MLEGKKVHPDVRFYVAPASWVMYKEAMDKGLLNRLVDAGVMIGNPSCGSCTGYQRRCSENFKNRKNNVLSASIRHTT